eukprot:ANDGO_04270.mRNA.1 Lysophospholipid acyltransferase
MWTRAAASYPFLHAIDKGRETLYSFCDDAALAAGLPLDQFCFILSMVFAISCSPLYRFVRHGVLRDLFSMSFGVAMLFFTFGLSALNVVILVLASFVMLSSPILTVAFCLTSCSLMHIYRMYYYYLDDGVDFSAPFMIAVLKIMGTSLNVADGKRQWKESPTANVSLQSKPGIMEYLGYCFFFPSVMAGPVFDFKTYRKEIHEKTTVPIDGIPFFKKVFWIAVLFLLFNISEHSFPRSSLDPAGLDRFSFGKNLLHVWIVPALFRSRFYLVWTLSEAALCLVGLSHIWNADWFGTEFCSSAQLVCNRWNHSVASWLQKYVYFRLSSKTDRKSGVKAQFATFFVSCIWHGFYPGYLFFFVSASILVTISKNLRRVFRGRLMQTSSTVSISPAVWAVYDFLGVVGTMGMLSYLGVPFMLLDWNTIIRFYNHFYWIGHIATLSVLLFSICAQPRRFSSGRELPPAEKKQK